jgi:hypothetical protein
MKELMWICDRCRYEYSAMLGDDEVPEICECGGKVREATEWVELEKVNA